MEWEEEGAMKGKFCFITLLICSPASVKASGLWFRTRKKFQYFSELYCIHL